MHLHMLQANDVRLVPVTPERFSVAVMFSQHCRLELKIFSGHTANHVGYVGIVNNQYIRITLHMYAYYIYIYRLTHIHSTLQHIIHKYTFKWRRNQPSFILWRICHKGYGSFPWAACNKKTCWALNATSCRITRNRHLPTLHSQKTNPRVAPSQFKRMKIKPK